MERYLLLRNNEQTGPHSYEELVSLGLQPQDLIWAEGRSASWKYPMEMEEFKVLIPAVVTIEKEYDRPPLSRTRLQNDEVLVNGLQTTPDKVQQFIPENDLYEFPTLARFFMASQYERQDNVETCAAEVLKSEKNPENSVKKSAIWVSLPSTVANKRIILIKGADPEKQSEDEDLISTVNRNPSINTNAQPKYWQTSELSEIMKPEPVQQNCKIIPIDIHLVSAESKATLFPVSVESTRRESDADELKIHFIKPSNSKKFYSISLQKIAVAVGLASIIMVASLIANSIISPGYEVKPKTLANNISKKLPEKPEAPLSVPAVILAANILPSPQPSINEDSLKAAALIAAEKEKLAIARRKEIAAKKIKEKKQLAVVVPEVLPSEIPVAEKEESTESIAQTALQAKKEETRKNISQLLEVQMDGYKVGLLGGIREFDLVVKNNSGFPIDRIVVELKYIQSNKKVFKTETVEINAIAAYSNKSIEVPKSSRGVKVESFIRSIASGDLSLSYSN